MKRTKPAFSAALIVLLLGIGSAVLAGPSKHTANHLRGHGDSLAGSDVSIDVGWVQSLRWKNTEFVSFFVAHTWDERENLPGGMITVAVDAAHAEAFVTKFKPSPDIEQRGWNHDLNTRRLYGALREGKRHRLFIDLTSGGVPDPDEVPAGNPIGEAIAEFFRNLIEEREALAQPNS